MEPTSPLIYDTYPQTVEGGVNSTLSWIGDYAYQIITYIPFKCVSIGYDCVVDGNQLWKQEKYDLSLKSIIRAFENQGISLKELEETFQKNEESCLQLACISVIKALLRDEKLDATDHRTEYRNFIDLLRNAIALHSKNSPYSSFLESVCLYRFTEFHFFEFCEILIDQIIKEGIIAKHQSSPRLHEEYQKSLYQISLKDQFSYIKAAPQKFKAPYIPLNVDLIKGGCNIAFDAQRRSNIPYVLFNFMLDGIDVRVLRSGSPTMQRNDYNTCTIAGEATITPEFECMIEKLGANGETLLHVSLQDDRERYAGSEHQRNNAFIELHNKYPKTFQLVILAHDSLFYHQEGDFKNIDHAEVFKDQFLKEMFSDGCGFFFPEGLKDREAFKEIMDEIHSDLFIDENLNKPKTYLIHEERLNFIELFYTRLTLFLLKKTKACYLINICKDSIDRAAIRNALFHYLLLIFFQKETCGDHLNALYTFLHAGAFLVKKRSLNSRQDRLISILNLLESKEIRERLLQRKESTGVTGDDLFIKTS